MLDYESFKQVFPRRLVKKLKSPLVPYLGEINLSAILKRLHSEIISYTYHPSLCHEQLIFNKNNGVIRICPIFKPKDSILYYFCIKMLEDNIAENRVEGTYGGWKLGNSIRFIEEIEEVVLMSYITSDSYNPFLWVDNWKDFQKKALIYSEISEAKYIVKLDIANFYDNINLSLLEKKIYAVIGNEKRVYVELLFYFLKNWNKTIAGFSENHTGLPQESSSDCSRLLANFYLQEYDVFMKNICNENAARYLRFSDDQILFTKSKEDANKIILEASKFLLNQGLSFNAGKTMVFKDKEGYNNYWSFDIFDLLEGKEKEKVNRGVIIFLDRISRGINFRKDSVLKRILGLDFNDITPAHRYKIFSIVYEKDFICRADYIVLCNIYRNIDENKKEEFLIILDDLIDSIIYNSFHYNLIKFYNINKIDYDREKLHARIKILKF